MHPEKIQAQHITQYDSIRFLRDLNAALLEYGPQSMVQYSAVEHMTRDGSSETEYAALILYMG